MSNPEQVNRFMQERAWEYKQAMEDINKAVAIYSSYYAAFLRGVYENDPDVDITPKLKLALMGAYQNILTKVNTEAKIISWDTETDVIILEIGRFRLKCYLRDLNENEQEAVCELEL